MSLVCIFLLRTRSYLVLSTSSQNGFPPGNFVDFAHQLLLAAETAPEPDFLSHMQHAVWGNGDPRWLGTYMNVPRFVDHLLEECGSRRFYARGEANEPHAPTRSTHCEIDEWASGMWQAMQQQQQQQQHDAAATPPPVAWDALWEDAPSPHHHEVRELGLEVLVKRYGPLSRCVSSFARPDELYLKAVDEYRQLQEKRAEQLRERMEARRRRDPK